MISASSFSASVFLTRPLVASEEGVGINVSA
jgi:hypothetical protein